MTPEDIIENMQYHILQIESNFEDVYNMSRDLSVSKKTLFDKLTIWKYFKKNFPEDFGDYNDGYFDGVDDSGESNESNESDASDDEDDEKEG